MIARVRLVCTLVFAVGGCARVASEEPPPPSPEESAVMAIDANPAATPVSLPPLSEEAQAYLVDCHHRFRKQSEETNDVADECLFREFDQNCSPDPSGCWEKGQACRDACGPPCATCDDACAGTCDGCRGHCKDGDVACEHACANRRVECRDACLATRDTCSEETCSKQEEACNAAHLLAREQKCPRCDQIQSCMSDAIDAEKDPFVTCRPKFKRDPEVCFEWCFEF